MSKSLCILDVLPPRATIEIAVGEGWVQFRGQLLDARKDVVIRSSEWTAWYRLRHCPISLKWEDFEWEQDRSSLT